MEIQDQGLPIHKDADAEDPPAHLPRGQLLRRPAPGHAGGADDLRRRHDPRHPDGDAGAARPGAHRAAAGHARGPPGDACEPGHGADRASRRPPRTPTRRRYVRGKSGGAGAQQRDPVRQDARCATASITQQALPGRRPARPHGPRPGPVGDRPRSSPSSEQQLERPGRRTSTRRSARSRASRATCSSRSRCSGRRCRPPTPRSATLNAALPDVARLRARDPARRRADASRRSTRSLRGSRRRASSSRRPSSAVSSPTCSRRRASLAQASTETIPAAASRATCWPSASRTSILPAGDVKLQDGPFSTDQENYKEFWYSMVGLAGEGQNFDGNGQYVRFQTGGGNYSVKLTGGNLAPNGTLFGNSVGQPLGTRPPGTAARSRVYKPRRRLLQADDPGLQRPSRQGRRTPAATLRWHSQSASTSGTSSRSSRSPRSRSSSAASSSPTSASTCPSWVPIVGSDFVDYKAEFQTAQAVTPGQGQTVLDRGRPGRRDRQGRR